MIGPRDFVEIGHERAVRGHDGALLAHGFAWAVMYANQEGRIAPAVSEGKPFLLWKPPLTPTAARATI